VRPSGHKQKKPINMVIQFSFVIVLIERKLLSYPEPFESLVCGNENTNEKHTRTKPYEKSLKGLVEETDCSDRSLAGSVTCEDLLLREIPKSALGFRLVTGTCPTKRSSREWQL